MKAHQYIRPIELMWHDNFFGSQSESQDLTTNEGLLYFLEGYAEGLDLAKNVGIQDWDADFIVHVD